MGALIRLTDAVGRAAALPDILEEALDLLEYTLCPDRSSVLLFDSEGRMRFRAWRNLSEPFRDGAERLCRFSVNDAPPAPFIVPDARKDLRYARFSKLFEEEGVRTFAFLPLSSGDRLLGLVMLFYRVNHTFSSREIELARAMAGQVGFALERKQTEERLRQLSGELEEAVRARDEFLAIASHELKTPLTSLQLHLDQARRKSLAGLDGKCLDRIEIAGRQVRRLSRLVDDLLDFSRISAGQLRLEREPFELRALAEDVLRRLDPELARGGCGRSFTCVGNTLGTWDRMRLDQVLSNLLTNALKYGEGHPIHVALEGGETHVRLSVRDDGMGIAPDDARRVFQRFERAVSSRHIGGFGVGLWIVRQIVEEHRGTIRVESAPGEGSTFIVDLPRGLPV